MKQRHLLLLELQDPRPACEKREGKAGGEEGTTTEGRVSTANERATKTAGEIEAAGSVRACSSGSNLSTRGQ